MTVAKKIEHLPHFFVSAVKVAEKSAECFELAGVFDQTENVAEGRCSLLLPDVDVLTALAGYLEFQNQEERAARIYTPGKRQPDVVGQPLIYVPAKWDPLQVWMVALPTWRWTKSLFHASDAIGEIVKDNKVSVVDNEEIKDWIKIRPKGRDTSLARYYPVFPSEKFSLQIQADGTIKDGWSHAHCELCDAHIDTGHLGYIDPGQNWVCEECYAKYVAEHDLSFMFV
jgi:hypothetical protein